MSVFGYGDVLSLSQSLNVVDTVRHEALRFNLKPVAHRCLLYDRVGRSA